MALRKSLLAAVAVAAVAVATPAMAKTFKWAFQGSVSTLDPHGLNETFLLGTLGNVYEGLVNYDENLKLIPSLAESWEIVEPTKWVFKLRKGVKFHEGQDFTADDVIFSWQRAGTEGSDQKVRHSLIKEIKKIDDHTIEVTTPAPNPLMAQDLVFLKIMDKEWSEANGTVEATNLKGGDEGNHANLNTNGTGPFMITENTQDVKTVFKRFDGYWKDIKSNVTEAVMTPIAQDATRVAALLSGELDLVYPVPVQDWSRLEDADGVKPLTGPEARTIFLGMDQFRDELLYSNIKGKNPFKDQRVRAAFAHAIDLETIKKRVMRGASSPTGLMVAPQINGFNAALNEPYEFNPEKSKQLLAEAGYPDGFELTMDCPNDRYVNDERICQAVASMLAKVGVKVEVFAQPKSKYFAKVLQQNGYDTSFYLIGWTPGSIDTHNVLTNLIACQNVEAKVGLFNMGNYCNARVDELTKLVEKETDAGQRQAYIDEAFTILKNEYGYLPLHQQPLSWGVRDGVSVAQRADNVLDFRNVVLP